MTQPVSGKHPKGLFVLFFTEMWERFSYYGNRALLVLYVVNVLMMSDEYANDGVYGSYTGLVYLTTLLGGYVADRLWGNRRSVITGGFLMAVGQFLMFFSASSYENIPLAHTIMWVALVFMMLGFGLFKPNISTLVGQLYPEGDRRLDAAYTVFYMGINLGAFIGPLVCGGLGNQYDANGQAVKEAFKWGFASAGVAMLVGTFAFIWLKNKYVVSPTGQGLGILPNNATKDPSASETTATSLKHVATWGVITLACILGFKYVLDFDWIGSFIFGVAIGVAGLIISDRSLTPTERGRVMVIFLSAFFVVFFWSAFEQAGSSLTLFAERNTDRAFQLNTALGNVILAILAVAGILYLFLQRIMEIPTELKRVFATLGIGALVIAIYYYIQGTRYELKEIPSSWFNSVNSMWLILVAPFLSQLWSWLGKKSVEPSSPKKQAIGLMFLAGGYLLIAYGVKDRTDAASMIWLLAMYFMHTVGELCLSPIGLSLVNRLAPARFTSILMGVWFLSNAVANKFGGKLGALLPSKGPTHFAGYTINNLYDFFMVFVVLSGAASILLFLLSGWMEKRMGTVK
ncbi:peptide MFS transporter [Paraflavitalea sp. CAU 1676]|uniref:peptide MFS transporter n=1 Tax=Paraflavitalea sp. CAU 1676 TaxID=3032598 RepID=UPI0023DB9DB6|nr:peptide MFS transporter [Paraflavitalea sp. CAU 1676]MDF2187233.1 peptide MFS transporter [Paraflavitalea sp. CAU 1676]